ncbi:MAG: hypothetical protein D6755_08490 [Anaerolineae bacterium]|nr:MAG: hypothetical protein D6755_08490 [Anaerolineae bacterium]
MLKKLFVRRKGMSPDEMQHLEARLQAALQPVEPSPEFVAGVQARLMRALARQEASTPSSAYVFGGLWRALTRYGSAVATLTGLRAWRGILLAVVFVLGGWQRSRKSLETGRVSSAA